METPQHLWTTCSTRGKHGHGEEFFFIIKVKSPVFQFVSVPFDNITDQKIGYNAVNRQSPLTQPIFFLWRKFMGDFSACIAVAVSVFLQGSLINWYCLFWQKTYSGRKFSVVWILPLVYLREQVPNLILDWIKILGKSDYRVGAFSNLTPNDIPPEGTDCSSLLCPLAQSFLLMGGGRGRCHYCG